tara:strand:- start:732 stop:2948 length:2217 start_codon:yes stop_codon:yes gene_type:complete
MPTWKKVVISGSGLSQLANDANYLAQSGTGAILTGSFQGDGSGLINVKSADSASIGAEIAALQTFSSSLDAGFTTEGELNASSSTLQTNIDAKSSIVQLNASSSTLQTNIDTKSSITQLNASSSALQTNIDAKSSITQLNASSSALTSAYTGADTTLSASLATAIATNASNIGALGDTYATDAELNASSSTLQGNIDTLGTNQTAALNASSSALTSAYIGADTTLSSSLAASIATESGRMDAVLAAAGADTDTFAEIVTLINSVDTDNDNAFAAHYTSSRGRLDGLEADSGSFSTRVTDLSSSITSLGDTYATDAELNASSSALQTNIDAKSSTIQLNASSSTLQTNIDAKSSITQLNASSSALQTNIDTKSSITQLNASSSALQTNIDAKSSITQLNASSSTLQSSIDTKSSIAELNASSSTLQSSIDTKSSITQLNASSSALTSAYTSADTTLSSSLAASIATNASNLAGLTSGELNSGSFGVTLDPVTGSIGFTEGLEIGDVYDQGNGTTDIRVPAGASWLELNYADTDFIYLDGTNAGIQVNTEGTVHEWQFQAAGNLSAPGHITLAAGKAFNGIVNATNGVISGSTLSSAAQGTVTLTTNGVATDIDTGLQPGDSPTFSNLTISGDLTTLGTVTNVNSTDLNIEDKFILLNSGSATGNSGLIVQNSASQGLGTSLHWDDTAKRWGLDFAGANANTDVITSDAHLAAVVTSDDSNYQKAGNIRIDGTDAYIYTA